MITVLSVAYSLGTVGLDEVGGAEVVLAQLDRALVERGHRSIVVAPQGSSVSGTLVATGALPAVLDDEARARAREATRRAIFRALERFDVDIVHLHGLDFADVMPRVGIPTVITLHLPVAFYPAGALLEWSARARLACVSRSQASDLPAPIRERAVIVENGVDLQRYRPRTAAHGYAVAMGRVCPEKNYPAAIEAARRAGLPLVLAGRVHPFPSHVRNFEEAIAPALGDGVRFIGPIGGARKVRLLSGARCVLVPSTARETSSLVAMEALACGTPVIAYRAGALGDVVEDGRTGRIVEDVASMAAAIAGIGSIDRRACREAAEQRFDARRSCDRWIALLDSVARRRGRHRAA